MVSDHLPLLASYFGLAPAARIADDNQLIGIDADSRAERTRAVEQTIVDYARLAVEDFTSVAVVEAEPDLFLENRQRGELSCEDIFKPDQSYKF